MEVTVKDPVSLFFVHCPFICWFSLAHSISFTEVPNVVVRSQTEGSLPRKSQQPAKKNDIWEPVLRSLVLAPFLISSFLAENCRMRSLNTFELVKDRNDSQFWLIWGYPHLRKRPCATKTSDVFQLSLIVSTRPDSAAQKMGVKHRGNMEIKDECGFTPWSHTHLWSPDRPRASGKRRSPPSWWKRVQHPRFLGPSSKIQPRTPDDFVYLLQDVARTHQSWVLRKFESKGYA